MTKNIYPNQPALKWLTNLLDSHYLQGNLNVGSDSEFSVLPRSFIGGDKCLMSSQYCGTMLIKQGTSDKKLRNR